MIASGDGFDQFRRDFDRRLYGASRSELDFGLDRIERALEQEGRPDRSAPGVLVAGTNGKGQTAAFLSGLLQSHGYRVGLFTSPHLVGVRERFRIDGAPVSAELTSEIGTRLLETYGDGAAESTDDDAPQLSYFELTTLMATLLFERADVDFAIYEVGMGGRLDATNAIEPVLGVITSVGFDHEMFLGSTIEEIATEQGGILRNDAPAVVGPQAEEGAHRFLREQLRNRQIDGRMAGENFEAVAESGEIRIGARTLSVFEGYSRPRVELWNAATALQAAEVLLEDFETERALEGIRRTRWPGRHDRRIAEPGRFEVGRPVEVYLDAAHNPQAVDELLDEVAASDFEVRAIVVGGMTDKKLESMFEGLAGGPPVWGAEIEGSRAARGRGLESLLPDAVQQEVGPVETVLARAVGAAADASTTGGVLAFGSTYLVGAVLEELGVEVDDLVTYE